MPKNVYAKLLDARAEFLKANIEKSGKNFGLAYKYFELSDIVPTATKIFEKVGLVTVINYTDTDAYMLVVNTEEPEQKISFNTPMKYAPVNKGTTEIQALGSTMTYLRRYLYLTALDICENDEVDAGGVQTPLESVEKPKAETVVTNQPKAEKAVEKPEMAQARQEAKEALTSGDQPADELQIAAIRKQANALMDIAPNDNTRALLSELSVETVGFSKVSRKRADEILVQLKAEVDKFLPF